jgi:uncharacterized lipoprotein YddW (UPF0748 family)
VPPKRELRAFWIATVENIDWPTQRNLTPAQYRREYLRLLDAGQRAGLNAVFMQIRPASDAFYQSDLEPWSKWLTGTQGKAPADGEDPLPFLITESHKRGMEFHAWFNPYRASMDSVTRRLAPTHPFRKHPEWFLRYGGKLLYNPGMPEVREYITNVILDVVRRYDIDAVHFDDYFSPTPTRDWSSTTKPPSATTTPTAFPSWPTGAARTSTFSFGTCTTASGPPSAG